MTELPDIEKVATAVHQSWMDGKIAKGITSRKAEDGEELMVPYAQLSEAQKDQDRAIVRTVYAAIKTAQLEGVMVHVERTIPLREAIAEFRLSADEVRRILESNDVIWRTETAISLGDET